MQRNTPSTSGQPKKSNRRRVPRSMPSQPPEYLANLVWRRRVWRFTVAPTITSTQVFTITPAKLCALVSIGTGATTVVQLFDRVQLHSIRMWSTVNPASLAPNQLSFSLSGTQPGILGNEMVKTSMSVGMTRVATLHAKTNPNTQTGQWQDGSTLATGPGVNTFFTISCQGGTVIDLKLSHSVTPITRVANNTTAITGPASVGQIYYLPLDNNSGSSGSGSSNLFPVDSLITIE